MNQINLVFEIIIVFLIVLFAICKWYSAFVKSEEANRKQYAIQNKKKWEAYQKDIRILNKRIEVTKQKAEEQRLLDKDLMLRINNKYTYR